jgi:hypothetical protein
MSLATVNPAIIQGGVAFATGLAAAAGTYIYIHKTLWSGVTQVAGSYGTLPPYPKDEASPFFGPKARAHMVRSWNGFIDSTIGQLAVEAAKRGW